MFQEELCIPVSLGGGTAEPVHRLSLVVSHALSCEVQLAQHILSVLVACLRRLGEPIRCSCGVLVDGVPLQILFAQTVCGEMASVFRRLFQPADALVRVPHLQIAGEEQLAKAYCASVKPCIAAWVNQCFAF